jgi:hypothetical protein
MQTVGNRFESRGQRAGNAPRRRRARLFGIGQHLLDSTLHGRKLFLEADSRDRTDLPEIVHQPRHRFVERGECIATRVRCTWSVHEVGQTMLTLIKDILDDRTGSLLALGV